MKRFCWILGFIWLASVANATHIVGGVIEYKYVSHTAFSATYDITIRIYKDHSPSALQFFDGEPGSGGNGPPAQMVFSATKVGSSQPEKVFTIPLSNFSKSVLQAYIHPCLTERNVETLEGVYNYRITLNDPTASYTLLYSRCCRNDEILNINTIPNASPPTMPGMSITAVIPPTTLYRNNSAVFKEKPPYLICRGAYFYFDHSATDLDGDSLAYSLRTPYTGMTDINPVANASLFQPKLGDVSDVSWKAPYSLSNALGGPVPLQIDPVSGLLFCKTADNVIGRFVVSVECKEYRNGVLINTFMRDYQFNVRACDLPFPDMPLTERNPSAKIGYYKTNCKNFTIQFENQSSNYDSLRWYFGEPHKGAANTSTAVNPSHTYSNVGRYIVNLVAYKTILANGQICADTQSAIVDIYPLFTTDFTFQNQCVGVPIQFTDATTSTHGNIFYWEWDFGGQGKSLMQNASFTFNTPGTYNVSLKAKDNKRCEETITKQVTVYPKPTMAYTAPQQVCQFDEVQIRCNSSVASPYSIVSNTWVTPTNTRVNNCNLNINLAVTGINTYRLVSVTNMGCRDSIDVPIRVLPIPDVTSSPDQTLCYDQNFRLVANGANTYQWTPTSFLDNPNARNPLASPPYPNSIRYTVTGTDRNGCKDTASTLIQFFTKPFISAGLDTSVCLNPSPFKFKDSVQLNGQGNFIIINWSPTDGLSNSQILTPLAKPRQNTDFILTGIDQNNCQIKDTVRVTVLDPALNLIRIADTSFCLFESVYLDPIDQGEISLYRWRPGRWTEDSTIRNPKISPLQQQLYILYLENYCYTKEDSSLLTPIPLPEPGIYDTFMCLGDLFQFNATPGMVSYDWFRADNSISNRTISNPSVSPTSDFMYKLRVVDANGCRNEDSMTLKVYYPPILNVFGVPNYICLGDTSGYITAISTDNSRYSWRPPIGILPSPDSAAIRLFPTDTITYIVRATTPQNCFSEKPVKINVQQPVESNLIPFISICKGDFKQLKAEGGLYYLWWPSIAINDTIIDTPQVNPLQTTQYFVRVSNDCFSDTSKVVVRVDSIPRVSIFPRDTVIYRGAEIKLFATSSAERYEWTPKIDNEYPYSPEFVFKPTDTTLMYVFATDANNCTGKDSVYIYVYGKTVLLLPTGFTPNKDGRNEKFRIVKHLNISRLNSFEVYNRWGQLVFSTSNLNEGWDGKIKDDDAPMGVYVWKIDATTSEGEQIKRSGNVTLVR